MRQWIANKLRTGKAMNKTERKAMESRPVTLTAEQRKQWEDTGLITFNEERIQNDWIWNDDGTLLGAIYDNMEGNTWRMATEDTVFNVQAGP